MYTGGTEATASVYLSVAFVYSAKQIKPCIFLAILGSNKWLVRKPFPTPKSEPAVHELTNLMQQLLISKKDEYIIKIGLRCIQNLCHQPSFLGPDLPQELLMESTDSPGKQIVGAMVSQEDV